MICIAPLVNKVVQGELAGKARLRGSCIAPIVERSKALILQGGACEDTNATALGAAFDSDTRQFIGGDQEELIEFFFEVLFGEDAGLLSAGVAEVLVLDIFEDRGVEDLKVCTCRAEWDDFGEVIEGCGEGKVGSCFGVRVAYIIEWTVCILLKLCEQFGCRADDRCEFVKPKDITCGFPKGCKFGRHLGRGGGIGGVHNFLDQHADEDIEVRIK